MSCLKRVKVERVKVLQLQAQHCDYHKIHTLCRLDTSVLLNLFIAKLYFLSSSGGDTIYVALLLINTGSRQLLPLHFCHIL